MSLNKLKSYDCVIMLTFSDWFSEMYSNRFHYASRFSKQLKVYFVQVNGTSSTPEFITTEFANIDVIKIDTQSNFRSLFQILDHVKNEGARRPLFWVYNPYFSDFLKMLKNPQIVYHATEDYFCDDFVADVYLRKCLVDLLYRTTLVVSVSEGVNENIKKNVPSVRETLVAENGCDFKKWSRFRHQNKKKGVVYQGGIHAKIDFELLLYVIDSNPDVEFVFCGLVTGALEKWPEILSRPNVKYKGKMSLDELVSEVSEYEVGIIPFIQNDWIINRSFPLKFFEYLSAGLRVVSVPIHSLPSKLYLAAQNKTEFSDAIRFALEEVQTEEALHAQSDACRRADYDSKFDNVVKRLNELNISQLDETFGLFITNTAEKLNSSGIDFKFISEKLVAGLNNDNLFFIDVVAFDHSVDKAGIEKKLLDIGFQGLIYFVEDEQNWLNDVILKIPLYSLSGHQLSLINSNITIYDEFKLKRYLLRAFKFFFWKLSGLFGINPEQAYAKVKSILRKSS